MQINEIISIAERAMGIEEGSVTWGLEGRIFMDNYYINLFVEMNEFKYINIMYPIDDELDEVERITEILDSKDFIEERAVVVLGCYGMCHLTTVFGFSEKAFNYVLRPIENEPEIFRNSPDTNPYNLSLN